MHSPNLDVLRLSYLPQVDHVIVRYRCPTRSDHICLWNWPIKARQTLGRVGLSQSPAFCFDLTATFLLLETRAAPLVAFVLSEGKGFTPRPGSLGRTGGFGLKRSISGIYLGFLMPDFRRDLHVPTLATLRMEPFGTMRSSDSTQLHSQLYLAG